MKTVWRVTNCLLFAYDNFETQLKPCIQDRFVNLGEIGLFIVNFFYQFGQITVAFFLLPFISYFF